MNKLWLFTTPVILANILLFIPFLLGNSAGAMAGIVGLIGIILAIVICIGAIYGVIKWLN